MTQRDLGRPSDPEKDVGTQRRYLEQLRNNPLWNGQLVGGTVKNGAAYVRIEHSLGYAYTGGWLVSSDGYVDTAIVVEPRTASLGPFKVRPEREVFVAFGSAVSQDTAVSLWIF